MTLPKLSHSCSVATRLSAAAAAALVLAAVTAGPRLGAQQGPPAPVVGPNVNMSAGPTFLKLGNTPSELEIQGDPLRNANGFELDCAPSSRNPLHFICFSNDNRAVDVLGVDVTQNGDSNVGMYQSFNAGSSWTSTLHPTFFPQPLGLDYAVDPKVSAGPAGMVGHVGLVKNRGNNALTKVYYSAFLDLNDQEGDRYPFKHLFTSVIATGTAGQSLDRPTVLLTQPQGATATFQVNRGDGTTVPQTVPVAPVIVSWVKFFEGSNEHSQVWSAISLDGGLTFGDPTKLSEEIGHTQGVQLARRIGSPVVCAAWRKGTDPQSPEGLSVACSQDGGLTFLKSIAPFDRLGGICPVDWSTTSTRFRTLTTPTIAADADRFYMAWAERPRNPDGTCMTNSFGSRIMVSTSADGAMWSDPVKADISTAPGFQIFPQLTFSGKYVNLAWFDSRFDEARLLQSSIDEAPIVNNQLPQGTPRRRHTIDMFGARALPGAVPAWGTPFRVSKYIVGTKEETGEVRQLQFNFPNVRLFARMTQPGIGDYIALMSEQWVPANPTGTSVNWVSNLGQLGDSLVWNAWADNRNVRLHSNEDYTVARDWSPAGLPAGFPTASIYDPGATRPSCEAEFVGMRDQNPYGALWTEGSLIGSLGNNRPMLPPSPSGAAQPRSMSVFAQNLGIEDKVFRFEIIGPPPNTAATFSQFGPSVQTVEAVAAAGSTVTRMAFVTSSMHRPPIRVDVSEIPLLSKMVTSLTLTGTTVTAVAASHGFDGTEQITITGANPSAYNGTFPIAVIDANTFTYQLAGTEALAPATGTIKAKVPLRSTTRFARTVWFNADPTEPDLVETPQTDPTFDVGDQEVNGIEIASSFIHDETQPLTFANAGWETAGWQEAGWQEAGWQEAGWQEAGWQEAGWETDAVTSTELQNGVVRRDVRFALSGGANTTQMLKLSSLLNGAVPAGLKFQFVAFRLSASTGVSCDTSRPALVGNKQVLVNVDNTNVSFANFSSGINSASIQNVTIPVLPGEVVYANLRIFDTQPGNTLPPTDAVLLRGVPGAVGTEDAATGITTPREAVSALAILKVFPPPNGNAGRPYTYQVQAIGGETPLAFTATGLPAGLKIDAASGLISQDTSVRPVAGTFTFTVTVSDEAGATANATFTITLTDIDPPVLTVPGDIVAEATSAAGALVPYQVTATDVVDPSPTIDCSLFPSGPSAQFPLGMTTVTCTARDQSSNSSASKSFTVTVRDLTPPTITGAASPRVIWSPNGKKLPVKVTGIATDSGSGVRATSDAITACPKGTAPTARPAPCFHVVDEYGLDQPNGQVSLVALPPNPDGSISYSYEFVVSLTASRKGSDKNGREYTIYIKIRDNAGNLGTSQPVSVTVHDQGS